MSETNFTPGPWTLETVRTSVGVCHKIGRLGSSTKLNHACLYDDCYSAQPRDLQLLADAQLIATAPELHETLKAEAAFLRRFLEQLIHVPTKDERGHIVNGFAAAQIPDWQIKQRLEDIDSVLAKVSVPRPTTEKAGA